MPCHSVLTQASDVKHVQAVTAVDVALLGTGMMPCISVIITDYQTALLLLLYW